MSCTFDLIVTFIHKELNETTCALDELYLISGGLGDRDSVSVTVNHLLSYLQCPLRQSL